MALARSLGTEKTLVRIESVAGMTSAPPTPMMQRNPISSVAELAKAERTEPAPNTDKPIRRAPLRPARSPRLPKVMSRPANTTV